MELNIVQGYFLNFEFNFTQNERSQVIHSGGYGVYAGPFPKPGKNHTSFPYFPAGPREGEMLLTSLAPWGWFLWEKKKNPSSSFSFSFLLYSQSLACLQTCKLLVQPFSFSLLPLCTHSPFPGIGALPGFDNHRPLFRMHHHPHPTLYLHLDVLHNFGRTCCSPEVVKLLESCIRAFGLEKQRDFLLEVILKGSQSSWKSLNIGILGNEAEVRGCRACLARCPLPGVGFKGSAGSCPTLQTPETVTSELLGRVSKPGLRGQGDEWVCCDP